MIADNRLRLERQEALTLPAPEGLQSPEDAVPLLHKLVEEEPYELLGTLFLDFQNRVTGYNIAYMGTMTRVAAEARGLLLPALLANAATILLFHNHPGGDTRPSPDDITMTGIVRQAVYILGIRVWDHLILGDPPAYQSIGQLMAPRRQPRPFRLPPMRPSKKARPKSATRCHGTRHNPA